MIRLSVILPTYNESKNVQILIPKIVEVLEKAALSFEIIVVDDDSPDLTWEIVRQKFAKDSRIKVIRRINKKGLSSAVLEGMEIAQGELYGVMDADLQHDENIIPKMVQEISDVEVVVGSRVVEDGGYGEWTFSRKFMSQAATFIAKLFFPLPIGDPMSGFFIIKKELYDEIASEINPRGFKILLEFVARKKGVRAKEVGYVFKSRIHGETKLSGSVINNYLLALFDIRFGKFISITFLKYAVTGFVGVFVNLIGQFLATEVLNLKEEGKVYSSFSRPSMAVAIGFEIAVLSNYIMNNLWTFRSSRLKGFKNNLTGFIRFQIVSFIGLFIQLSVWRFSLEMIQRYFSSLNYDGITYVCNFLGIIFATAGNYYLNKNFTWDGKE
jgi:dolichol-phosphate mannosyltransferase